MFPQTLCKSCFFVIRAPMALLPDQVFGSWWMSVLMWWSFVVRASMRWEVVGGMYGLWAFGLVLWEAWFEVVSAK